MNPENARKADELIRMLGRLGQAQENSSEESELADLTGHAIRLHTELAAELNPAHG